MKKLLKLFLLIVLLCCGCEDRIDQPLSSVETGSIVVEAHFTNENKNQLVKLTKPYLEQNGSVVPVSGATVVVVEGADTFYPLVETPAGSGEYFTSNMIAVFGRVYTLVIRHQGGEFVAQARSVPVEPLSPLTYENAGNDQYRLMLNESGSESNYIEYELSWADTPVCNPGTNCLGLVTYYDLKNVDVQDLFKPDKKDFLFPVGTRVIRRKYSVAPEYRDFLRSVLSETEWRGGIFDIQRANASGNVSGALGFFAVSSVQIDTTFIVDKP
ncbi:MAG: DUF4249 family protein [Cyclobacteriaceae bacterium]|nr:DUF4249 domain-containing protein [Cyclobacteriaceae bacterium]